jgi:arylsulfatase A-like enzyme
MKMSMKIKVLATYAAVVTLVFSVGSASAQANNTTTAKGAGKPNIVHIVADDLGWKDVGFNGATDIKTPNLDKLAAEGVKFTQFYVQPMCTPTRAALMTGRYPFRYGLETAVIPSVSSYGLDTTECLLPQSLQGSRLQHRHHR